MPAKIALPAFLKSKLEDSTHEAAVQKALKDFGRWFGDESKLTFFPDYTNHGIQHIRQVLDTATNLIPQKARDYFSADDAAALILAVLLHDSALHLSKAGFWYLIKGPKEGGSPFAPVPFFDQADWGQTWSDFMFLARRWDDTMLLNVFGEDGTTGAPRAQVRDPFDHWSNLSETDNLLIGEFIRKHHPRLAHEMALHGVPGHEAIYLKLDDDLPLAWRDLAGLIARSHGLPLRTGLDYLRETPHFGTTGHRSYQSVHAVYLMTLLRVGDYIQIQGDRTSERIFAYKDIPSLVSRVEHKVHLSDILISADGEDPESLQIDASPKEVAVFLRLKEWLAGIQQELDGSWAVLGEVYGLHKGLRKLGLTFRRVRSNLDNVKEFAKTVSYVPDRIRFDVARAELLKLLIGPLYGDDPSYGVRELMQNSIDAVREYDQFVLDNPEYANVQRREQEADVVIELGPPDEVTGYAVMTISDRGIGMKEEVIRDYFLKAGASYRKSAEWKDAFENEEATSKVLRSGRFGVGALAVFLIGEEMEVETRHVEAKVGYSFTTTLEVESINVKRLELPVGTCIRVRISPINQESLVAKHQRKYLPSRFNWYLFNKPSVLRRWYVDSVSRSSTNKSGIDIVNGSQFWHRVKTSCPYDVYWTLGSVPNLMCNGLFISNSSSLRNVPYEISGFYNAPIMYPQVSIIDPDGRLPLNLERNNLRTESYDFGLELIRDVLQEMLAWLLFNGPNCIESSLLHEVYLPWLSGYNNYSSDNPLVALKHGYGLSLATLLDGLPVNHVINYVRTGLNLEAVSDDAIVFGTHRSWNKNTYESRCVELSIVDALGVDTKISSTSRVVFYHDGYQSKSFPRGELKIDSFYSHNKSKFKLEQQRKGWLIASQPSCPTKGFVMHQWPELNLSSEYMRNTKLVFFYEHFFPENSYFKATSKPWLLDELWQEHFGKNWIPFALEDRIAKFSEAAQVFKERYPQVVPDEAWALLGGKPA